MEEQMIYQISFQRKQVAKEPYSEFNHSVFVESQSEPSREEVLRLVEKHTAGDFAPETVEIEKCPNIKLSELKESTVCKLP